MTHERPLLRDLLTRTKVSHLWEKSRRIRGVNGVEMNHTRRTFLQVMIASAVASKRSLAQGRSNARDDRTLGLLAGSCIGDALGGPVEFRSGPAVDALMLNTRRWDDDRQLTSADLKEWASTLSLHDYSATRPNTAAYGQWYPNAPAGTMTDDTRHKVILLNAIQTAMASGQPVFSADDIARAYLEFRSPRSGPDQPQIAKLCEAGFREYRMAARWRLGVRDLEQARPIERLWGGVPQCSGQMLMLPLAAAYPGRPEAAYRAAYALDFVDNGAGRDITAALVAGLAELLGPNGVDDSPADRWRRLLATMRDTDPFEYGAVPFIGRRLNHWLNKAETIAETADGSPKRLFKLLETDGEPRFWWDAHFTLLCPIALATFCRFDPLAALNLTLDFGHDTDSYAQVLGAIVGVIHGASVFPRTMIDTIAERLRQDLGQTFDAWGNRLGELQQRLENGQIAIYG